MFINFNLTSRNDKAAIDARAAFAATFWFKMTRRKAAPRVGLQHVCETVGAELAVLSRIDHKQRGPDCRVQRARVLAFDCHEKIAAGTDAFRFSVADSACGNFLSEAHAGSTWRVSAAELGKIPRLGPALRHRALADAVVIPLEQRTGSSDFLELFLAEGVLALQNDMIRALAPRLSRIWRQRTGEIGLETALQEGMTASGLQSPGTPQVDILAFGNPCNLTRVEYRVCVLLNCGLSRKALRAELSITEATLRNHLRKILSKTGTTSQSELQERLLAVADARAGHVSGGEDRCVGKTRRLCETHRG